MLERRLDQYFAELRSLLQQRPHAHRWERVCWYAERIAVLDHDYFEQAIAPYIKDHAASWPDSTRLIPERWLHQLSAPELPDFLRICRGIGLIHRFDGGALELDDIVRACVELELSFIGSSFISWDQRSLRRVLLGGHVRHLCIEANDDLLATLIEAGAPSLTSLDLQTSALDVIALLRSTSWPKLSSLSLDLYQSLHSWDEASSWIASLDLDALSLNLSYDWDHVYPTTWHISLFAALASTPLKHLSLKKLEAGDELEDCLLSLPQSLESLHLEFFLSPPPSVLARGLRARQLRELGLWGVEALDSALRDWFSSTQAQSLERLTLDTCEQVELIIEQLCAPDAPRGLRVLELKDISFERPLASLTRPAPWTSSLEQLKISSDRSPPPAALMEMLSWPMPNLLELELCGLGSIPMNTSLERCAPTLHTLNVADIDAQGVAFIASSAPEGLVELALTGHVLVSFSSFISSPVLRRLERWHIHDFHNDVAGEDIDALLTQLATTPGAAQLLYLSWPRSPQPQTLEQIRRSTSLNARFTLSFVSEDHPRRVWFSRASLGDDG